MTGSGEIPFSQGRRRLVINLYVKANKTDSGQKGWSKPEPGLSATNVTKIPKCRESVKSGSPLLKWSQEFQREHTNVTHNRLSKDLGGDRRSFVWNDAGRRGWGRRGHGNADNLIRAEKMG